MSRKAMREEQHSGAIGFAKIVSADQCESGGTISTRARARASKAPHWPRGQVDSRSRDAALDVIQQSLLGMAVADEVKRRAGSFRLLKLRYYLC